jgi:endo-1,3(4)-beta-glucanase
MDNVDIFSHPIDTRHPPSMMKVQDDHPVPRVGVAAQPPLQTNKFYANFFLGDQRGPTYTFPYSIAWAGGKGAAASWGMVCSHVEAKQRVFGQEKPHGASSYFLSPIGIESMVISAKELGKETALTVDSMTAFSARVHLSKSSEVPPAISFPLVQGMAYVTAEFNDATPILQSAVYFKTVTKVTKDPKQNLAKYNFNLEDGSTWRVYAYKTKGEPLDLQVVNNGFAAAAKPFTGIIQITKDPMTPGSEDELDDGAGIYPVTLELSGITSADMGSYTFNYRKGGHDVGNLYLYALPHHVNSFNEETKARIQRTKMQSTTKGIVSLVKGTEWTMVESHLPVDMEFAPWHPEKGTMKELSDHAKSLIHGAAAKEITQNMIAQTNLDSMYFSGKVRHYTARVLVQMLTQLKGPSQVRPHSLCNQRHAWG